MLVWPHTTSSPVYFFASFPTTCPYACLAAPVATAIAPDAAFAAVPAALDTYEDTFAPVAGGALAAFAQPSSASNKSAAR